MATFSTTNQLAHMRGLLVAYLKLPPARTTISGDLMEAIVAHVHGGEVLHTYDFVDVIDERHRCGWQVKSTKSTTPVTWKRAKIPNAADLIETSERSYEECQKLGMAIMEFCNEHAQKSMERYQLDKIGYSRLIIDKNQVRYFERLLCSKERPDLFDPQQFSWHWSTPRETTTKEQLRALHGIHLKTCKRWWAWHGLGENQLHFTGEKEWWPDRDLDYGFTAEMPSEKERIGFDQLLALLDA